MDTPVILDLIYGQEKVSLAELAELLREEVLCAARSVCRKG
jgi:hypothetical protein